MTLRTCMEVLRENQMCGTTKVCDEPFFGWDHFVSLSVRNAFAHPPDGAVQGLKSHTFVQKLLRRRRKSPNDCVRQPEG